MAQALISPKAYFWNGSEALAFGKVYFWQAGTTNVPLRTFTEEEALYNNPNPVELNSEGWADIWLAGSYFIEVYDQDGKEGGNLIWSQDNWDQSAIDIGTPAKVYDYSAYDPGTPLASLPFIQIITARNFSVLQNADGSAIKARVAPGADIVFDLQKNGVSFGSMTILNGQATGTFTVAAQVDFAAGDELTVMNPSNLQGAAGVRFTLKGQRN
jgi:hypothetical protein